MGWKWKTAPVYPGVPFDLGDTYYNPSTNRKGMYHSTKLILDSDNAYDRINKQTSGNIDYIARPYSQSDWKPKVDSNQKKSSTSTGKPRTSTPSTTGKPRTATKAPTSNSWINKSKGIWNYNGVSQADVANAYKTGDFSKVESYLSQHKDLASYLNNIYSKRGGNQFNSSTPTQQATPIKGTPGYGIHVGNDSVTLSTPNGQTTDITNSYNVSTLINNGNYKAPNLGGMTTNYLENRPLDSYSELTKHNFDRGDIRQGMRANGINPYDYSGSDRKQLRTYLNNPTTDNYTQSVSKIIGDGKIQQNMLNNAVQNQTSQYQLTKPNLVNLRYDPSLNNQLVNLKFEQGGLLKFDDGETMEDFKKWLSQKLSKGELEESDLSKEKLAQLYQTFKKEQQGVQTAMNGAKLNYINKLNGKCPQGTHLSYYRIGGTLCKKCEADAYNESSDPIKAFKQKCGGKVKKATKQKCGGKVKKKELGGEVDDKKNQPKPKLVKKPQNKIIPKKPQNPRPGPKDLKKLPNGKYPKYWTADQRGQWDRDHDEGV